MTYYEEDNPEIESAENEDTLSPEEQFIKNIEKAAAEQRPMLMPQAVNDQERHEEMMEMLGGIFVQVSRMYDVLMMIAENSSRVVLEESHSQGKLLGDPPALREDAWS